MRTPDNPGDPAHQPLDALGAAGRTGGGSRDQPDQTQQPFGESGALGQTEHVHSVTPEAKWGVTSGSPSGGVAGGTPANQVAELIEEE